MAKQNLDKLTKLQNKSKLYSLSKSKTIVVSGASSGLGLAIAKTLFDEGNNLILICRTDEKCAAVQNDICKTHHNSEIISLAADLSSQLSIKTFVGKILASVNHIDVLVNNASCVSSDFKLTCDGIELQFAVNHLAPFLLCHHLLPLLEKSESGRIINVNSRAHARGTINFDDIFLSRNYNISAAYNQSKLANMLFTYAIAEKLKHSNITVNAFHPGLMNTDFGIKGVNQAHALIWKVVKQIGRSPKVSAQDAVYLATSDEVEGVTGKYFHNKNEIRSSTQSYNKDWQTRLWDISLGLTNISNNNYGKVS